MTEPSSPHDMHDTDKTLSQKEGQRLERTVALFGVVFFALLATGIWFAVTYVTGKPLPTPSFVPTGDIATQSEINRIAQPQRILPPQPAQPLSVTGRPQHSEIDGAPPQPVFQSTDTLQLQNPRHAYDLPVGAYDSDPKWRTVRGRVTAHAPRTDRMSDGSRRKNIYARTEFYAQAKNMNCYFHQYMGAAATLQVDDVVLVQYDPAARDACGTARIVK